MVSILVDDDMLLRSYQLEDVESLFNAVNDSRKHLRVWFDWVDQTTKPEHTQQFINLCQQKRHAQEGLVLGIFHKGAIIGEVAMHHWDHAIKKAELGYWISGKYEGKGIITKALVRFMDFLFENLGLNRLEIRFSPTNKRSGAVAERLHFKIEGVLRKSYMRHGNLEDVVVTGLLREEWMAAKKM